MPNHQRYDATIVGSGPNGLAAAITLARAGRSVIVFEALGSIGGGTRTEELTLPGFWHDVCSAIHPLGIASPFFREQPLETLGLEWIHPQAPLAHPLPDGTAAVLERSTKATGETLGRDGAAYRKLMDPFVVNWEKFMEDFLGPFPFPPKYPIADLRFGLQALRSARGLAESRFKGERARALFAGMAAHSIMPLEKIISASFGLMLGLLGHAVGWPMPRHGSQSITNAMATSLRSLGGEIITDHRVKTIDELPPTDVILLDVTPRQLIKIAGHQLPEGYKRQLMRYRYGPGVFKVDWALSQPIPWRAAECLRAGTVHVGGTLPEIAASEAAAWRGEHSEEPFVLVAQQSLFDPSRAPDGKHTGWAYCHVPHGSTLDMTGQIEAQIERFAPGFQDCILARNVIFPSGMEAYNPNYIGGDINGGAQDIRQFFTRPAIRWDPYSTPNERIYICSSSTPPGGGVHGMCGYYAARSVLRKHS